MEGIELLNDIRLKMKVKKSKYNSFGEFNYRSCEDILEAVKPLLGGSQLLITDDIIMIGDRYYVKSTAEWSDGSHAVRGVGFAREPLDLPKMNQSQATGSASSYARKYALSALFLLDDTRDSDTTNKEESSELFDKWKIKAAELSESSVDEIKAWWVTYGGEVKNDLSKADAAKIYEDLVKLIKKGTPDGNNN